MKERRGIRFSKNPIKKNVIKEDFGKENKVKLMDFFLLIIKKL
jgi:hypothetical protein